MFPSAPRYKIFAKDESGNDRFCFTWTRDLASGLRRAEYQAKEFGFEWSDFWGEEIPQEGN